MVEQTRRAPVRELTLARVKNRHISSFTHASPDNSRIARLGTGAYVFGTILRGIQRTVVFNPATHSLGSSFGLPFVVATEGNLAAAVVRDGEILNIGLKPGNQPGRNNVQAVLAF